VVDASRYLDILEKKYSLIKKEQDNYAKNINIRTTKNNTTNRKNKDNNQKNISDTDFLIQAGIIKQKSD